MLDLIPWGEILQWLPVVGVLGGGDGGFPNPFSKNFAKSEQGGVVKQQVADPSRMERGLYGQFNALSADQAAAIRAGLQQAQQAPNFQSLGLNPQDQAALDQAYSGAEMNMRRQAGLLGQDLASTRGLNMSDTPVSEVVMREFMPAMASLQGEKAQYGLGLGLNMRSLGENARQFNLSSLFGGSQLSPGAGLNLMGTLQNNRFANSKQTTNNWKIGSPLDNMEQVSRIYANVGQGTGGFMGAKSDVRLKENITPVSWDWKAGGDAQLGVIAQQVAESHPHLVHTNAEGHLMVDYGTMVAMLLSERQWLYNQLTEKGVSNTHRSGLGTGTQAGVA